MLKVVGGEPLLTVKRGDQTLQVRIKLERMIWWNSERIEQEAGAEGVDKLTTRVRDALTGLIPDQ